MADLQFPPGQDMSDVDPKTVEDAKLRAKQTKAYNKADGTPPAPAPKASAPKKYAKGGKIDGIAQRGKTRGRVI